MCVLRHGSGWPSDGGMSIGRQVPSVCVATSLGSSGTQKARLSFRAVPMANRVDRELDQYFQGFVSLLAPRRLASGTGAEMPPPSHKNPGEALLLHSGGKFIHLSIVVDLTAALFCEA